MQPDREFNSASPVSGLTGTDIDHLKLLAVFHYLYAGLVACGGCCLGIYMFAGLAMASGKLEGADAPPPEVGWLMTGFGGIGMLIVLAFAVLIAVAGRKLQQRRGHMYCIIIAGLLCLSFPIGTVLGVLTLIVLLRPGVKQGFGVAP